MERRGFLATLGALVAARFVKPAQEPMVLATDLTTLQPIWVSPFGGDTPEGCEDGCVWTTYQFTAGEDLHRGAVYIGADGKVYNTFRENEKALARTANALRELTPGA